MQSHKSGLRREKVEEVPVGDSSSKPEKDVNGKEGVEEGISSVGGVVGVNGTTGHSWTLTVVYASPSCISRRVLWDNLSRLAQSVQGAWLLGGDFNGTLLLCERRSNATFRRSIDQDFSRWVDTHDLRDMGFVGPEFTWKEACRGTSR
ncbi:hypothetical protein K1719_019595 [Acacia pycnantha]|nr:hypothetical protein K1719_019595 [Acacia pycnantha]